MKPIQTMIFEEFSVGNQFKSALGSRGLFEQNKINERFFIGDQWYGANCGSDRPLVRHNVIKRIGDYKMSQILNAKLDMKFSAEGIPYSDDITENFSGKLTHSEIGFVMTNLSNYFKVSGERVNLESLSSLIVRNAYISGTSLLYTYWDSEVPSGTYADDRKTVKIKGDICCELLKIEDVVFGDPYCINLQNQPYIIISASKPLSEVLREARLYGASLSTLKLIEESAQNGKVTLLTKLYKAYDASGNAEIMCTKVTRNTVIREEFSTGLRLYPIAEFKWENKNSCAYGESEITYLIPNQIAINRLITANVWGALSTGLPIMLVNGDTVSEKITNDPGQIIKIYGSNEDVAGAVKYVTPPNCIRDFDDTINTLINNTLTQSGANEVALGDSRADNATALMTMRNAAIMPLQIVKNRYYGFLEQLARIWADFWVTHYGKRPIKITKNGKTTYIPFDGDRYKELVINATVDVSHDATYTDKEQLDILLTLFDKGIISKAELLSRIPKGMVPNLESISKEEDGNDRI